MRRPPLTCADRVTEGRALTALCETAEAEEAHGATVELGQEALAVHRETGHRLGEAGTLMALARAHRKTDGTAAELMRRQARAIFSDIGVPDQNRCTGLGCVASCCTVQRRLSTGCPPAHLAGHHAVTTCCLAGTTEVRSVIRAPALIRTRQSPNL
jgi:hypothetical protein